eukprot:TRINITY_DN37696_c1_g2_i1.p1 TRINITY_DN37696_c1_g2~~TRINITY_DN37696_c1_g2_i1.p1  ORF type:complete len:333 (-),score=12.45 TRINITY_DN37696_c1_g2_i1:489-1487(-)
MQRKMVLSINFVLSSCLGVYFVNAQTVSPEESFIQDFCAGTTSNYFLVWSTDGDLWKPRYQRSVESVLYHHPNACVRIYSDGITANHSTIKQLNYAGYRVAIIPLETSLETIFKDTPIEQWWERNNEWKHGQFFYSHISEALRLVLVWKYGGTYIDTDVVILKNMEHVKNAVGAQMAMLEDQLLTDKPRWADMLNSAILTFQKGHPSLWVMMEDFVNSYHINSWAHNGPRLVTRIAHQLNQGDDYSKWVTILPRNAFHPLVWTGDREQGAKNWFNDEIHSVQEHYMKWQQMKSQGYALHWHNHNTKGYVAKKGSLMYMALNEFCILCKTQAD